MSGGFIGCFGAFALEADEMAGTKQGPSRDQVLHWEKHQFGTKSGTTLGPSQTGRELGYELAKGATKGPKTQ